MAGKELIIDDDFCKSMGEYYKKQGEHIDAVIDRYTAILQQIRDNAITSGDVADALSTYISYVERMKHQVGMISGVAQTQIVAFLTKVDEADQYLF